MSVFFWYLVEKHPEFSVSRKGQMGTKYGQRPARRGYTETYKRQGTFSGKMVRRSNGTLRSSGYKKTVRSPNKTFRNLQKRKKNISNCWKNLSDRMEE